MIDLIFIAWLFLEKIVLFIQKQFCNVCFSILLFLFSFYGYHSNGLDRNQIYRNARKCEEEAGCLDFAVWQLLEYLFFFNELLEHSLLEHSRFEPGNGMRKRVGKVETKV